MMRKKIWIILGIIAITLISLYAGYSLKDKGVQKESGLSAAYITCRYYDENSFRTSVKKAEEVEVSQLEVFGGITPHHLYADHMIAQFFKEIASDLPKVVVLIGPNHERRGKEKIHTGSWSWQTPFGMVKAEEDIVKLIAEKMGAGEDRNLLESDHSISALMPYVKYYLPEAQVVPLILHGNLGLDQSKQLAETILECIGEKDYLVIGSLDFSHYLPPGEAERMDEVSIKAIKERDLQAISRMDNDNLDSPPTVMTLLEIMNRENILGLKVIDHSNSAIIAGQYAESTTSYFTLLFHK